MTLSHPSVPAHSIAPAYTGRMFTTPVPALRLPEESMDPEAAYRFIHDELMLDGSSRLNLATFVTTWMDPEAEKLMAETFDKNMIDKDEYPITASIEQRCVCMVADLFHADAPARRRSVQRLRGVHHRLQRGRHARWSGAQMALARKGG